jgi:hypothetical protein
MARRAQLAHEEGDKRRVERLGYWVSDWYPAAWQCQHNDVGTARIGAQPGRQCTAGFPAIFERTPVIHRHVTLSWLRWVSEVQGKCPGYAVEVAFSAAAD